MIRCHELCAARKARAHKRWVIGYAQRGFTLIELVIALAVGAVVALAVVSSISQVFIGSARSSNHMTAVRQVQNAGYWVSRDAAMAHSIIPTATATPPELLLLSWTDWPNRVIQVRYVLEDAPDGLKNLRREQSVDGAVIGSTLVGQHIDGDQSLTIATYTPGSMTFKVTAKVGAGGRASTETRTYEVRPRPG
jgi:prepilin-type N-terminal cleavage/methylation domain-containing protein